MAVWDVLFAALMAKIGHIFQLVIFANTEFSLLWLLFFLQLFSQHAVSFVVASCCIDQNSASRFGYGWIFFSMVMVLLLGEGTFLKELYLV